MDVRELCNGATLCLPIQNRTDVHGQRGYPEAVLPARKLF